MVQIKFTDLEKNYINGSYVYNLRSIGLFEIGLKHLQIELIKYNFKKYFK